MNSFRSALQREAALSTSEVLVIRGVGEKKDSPDRKSSSDSEPSLSRRSGSETLGEARSPEKYIYIPDWQKESEDSSEEPEIVLTQRGISPLLNDPALRTKHRKIWIPYIDDHPRLISHGDLFYDLEQVVLAVLPFYPVTVQIPNLSLSGSSSPDEKDRQPAVQTVISPLILVKGVVIDIDDSEVGLLDIPREMKLRTSPEKDSKWRTSSKLNTDWAEAMMAYLPTDSRDGKVQTMVTKLTIKLDEQFWLTGDQVAVFNQYQNEHRYSNCLPTRLDYNFQSSSLKRNRKGKKTIDNIYDIITVPYRYITGTWAACLKTLPDGKKSSSFPDQLAYFQRSLRKLDIWSGTAVRYEDPCPVPRLSQAQHRKTEFLVLDHFSTGPLNIKFIVRCLEPPQQILALVKTSDFDVRGAYNVDQYYSFQPSSKELCDIVHPQLNSLLEIRRILKELFQPLKVYIVQKSLCSSNDIASSIYEDSLGGVQYLNGRPDSKWKMPSAPSIDTESRKDEDRKKDGSRPQSSPSLKFSGISLVSYIKGLAYPEGRCPTESNSYIFFHSKDYHELNLDPRSEHFLEFQPVSDKQLFRNPVPRDIILAIPFVCEREQFKGKTNLKWFYPTEEFRLLHLYITSNGEHLHFQTTEYLDSRPQSGRMRSAWKPTWNSLRTHFTGNHLHLLDLFLFGVGRDNPTISSPFTKQFLERYFWWETIRSLLHLDDNFSSLLEDADN